MDKGKGDKMRNDFSQITAATTLEPLFFFIPSGTIALFSIRTLAFISESPIGVVERKGTTNSNLKRNMEFRPRVGCNTARIQKNRQLIRKW